MTEFTLGPREVVELVIGLGGATVVKRMWRDYPEMHIDAIEIDTRSGEYLERA